MKSLSLLIIALFLFVSLSHAQLVVNPVSNKPVTSASVTTTKTKTKTAPAKKNITTKSKFNFDKSADKANTAVTNTNNRVTKTSTFLSSTTDAAKKLVHTVGALIPAGKSKVVNTTLISIKGITFSKLNKLNDYVDHCSGVKDSKIKYSHSHSTITVTHTGTTAKLLKQLEKRSKDIFTQENVDNANEGNISIKLN
ncbi:MAG: hypothetical protein JST32_08695 [Bacteroidetes bacterium]|nr:hypothetical protein [Bacteroidota bacterium]